MQEVQVIPGLVQVSHLNPQAWQRLSEFKKYPLGQISSQTRYGRVLVPYSGTSLYPLLQILQILLL